MKLAAFVKARRTERGLSLKEVERRGGVSDSTVNDIEMGRVCDIKGSVILGLSKALGVQPAIIIAAVAESLEAA